MHFFRTKKNTEEKIKEATYELLANYGYAKISMRDIARKAQTAVGQLTYYYGTKEHLIVSVISDMINDLISELEDYIKKQTDKIKAMNSFFDNALANDDETIHILLDFSAQSLWSDTFKSSINELLEKVKKLSFNCYKECGLDDESSNLAADSFITNILGKMMKSIFDTKAKIQKEIAYGE